MIQKKKMRQKFLLSVIAAALLMSGCGASSSNNTMEAASTDAIYSEAYAIAEEIGEVSEEFVEVEDDAAADSGTAENTLDENTVVGRKLITTMNLSVETEEFESLMKQVETEVDEYGGYVENSEQWNGNYRSNSLKSAYVVIRIPAEKLDEFLGNIAEVSNITSQSKSVQDVTLQYVDLESHKKALKAEETRLLELLEQAETVEDLIAVEDKLADVRYQLESMESQLRTYDNRINYSTVYIDIYEVNHITPVASQSVLDRITTGFSENLYNLGCDIRDLGIAFVVNIPYIVAWAIVIGVLAIIILKVKKVRGNKKQKKQEDISENNQENN